MSTFVLIHGAGDTRFYWHRVEPLLRDRGHDVVAVDLPADDPDAGLPEYVAAVLEAIGDRNGDLVVVGQSLGGFTAGQIPKHRPVREVVYVNAMIPAPGETAGEWWSNTEHGVEIDDEVAVFCNCMDPAVLEEYGKRVRDESGAMDQPFPDDVPPVPVRAVVAADDRFFPLDWMVPVVRDRTGADPIVIPGDHCVALSRPADLVEALTA